MSAAELTASSSSAASAAAAAATTMHHPGIAARRGGSVVVLAIDWLTSCSPSDHRSARAVTTLLSIRRSTDTNASTDTRVATSQTQQTVAKADLWDN